MPNNFILECYASYLAQLSFPHNSFAVIKEAIARDEKWVGDLLSAFESKFHPHCEREIAWPEWERGAESSRHFCTEVVKAMKKTVRTNAYCPDHKALSIKILHQDGMIELFSYHPLFQGVLLKKEPMARGGLRWSDRQDFRNECLNLMHTQALKNAIIVPSGAKGAFLLTDPDSRDGLTAYKLFIESILDLSDQRTHSGVVPPQHVRCYDGPDFYNVVGADKGTAFFSDEANAIALKRDYWLGDAFASGGSQGYNHKKLAITSRGAWISARHHLQELGIKDRPLTVVGIGDMSGDVFGNGLLGDHNLKLVAAFNHDSIFIDPDPDPEISYQERCRLFHLPKSRWKDYNKLSKGGRVYARFEGPIELTPESQDLLQVNQVMMETDEVISHMLKLSVDMMWLGGIGTYVKGEGEQNVDDLANQGVRINGGQVRAKIVVEGANLGFTQQGRIDYARSGGAINTDAIDNAAGVNCSDHEINIKILLGELVRAHQMTQEERNETLKEVTDDVCTLVLSENKWQNIALSVAAGAKEHTLSFALTFLDRLNVKAMINQDELAHMKANFVERLALDPQGGITRPEMSFLLAYSKMAFKKELADMELGEVGDTEVLDYFPSLMRDRFSENISNHLLYPFLKQTVLTNHMINLYGPLTFYHLADQLGVSFKDIVWSAIQFDQFFEGRRIAQKIEGSLSSMAQVYTLVERMRTFFVQGVTYSYTKGVSFEHLRTSDDLDEEFLSLRALHDKDLSYITI
jgi:glutamate dehydrogenase